MAMNPLFKEFGKPFEKDYKRVLKAILRYDHIAVFRHIMPDFDALGTQFGLATWLKDNFPNKDIRVLGDNHVTFTPRIYPETDNVPTDWFNEPFLAIILDVGNTSRIADPRWKKAKYKIKIDHHPDVEHFGKISIVNTDAAAASEIVCDMILHFKGDFVMSDRAASYFYSAIVGDS
ncbi:MAG: DHH family phosphoesterase, partial [Bacilli bacterium]|nr:DHH family phosphoesterase [Bacilli bacterium]